MFAFRPRRFSPLTLKAVVGDELVVRNMRTTAPLSTAFGAFAVCVKLTAFRRRTIIRMRVAQKPRIEGWGQDKSAN